MKQYDLFISHASEDKELVARPLAQKFSDIGLSVWFDEFTLNIGDSLSESIDKGLMQSDYALVILSHNFFAKNWPKKELSGLVARETIEGEKVILPIWHNLSAKEVLSYSPTLADRKALSTINDFENILDSVLRLIARPKWVDATMSQEAVNQDSSIISTLVHCFLGLQDLYRIEDLFPDIMQSHHIQQIWDSIIQEIELHRLHPKLTDLFAMYKRPSLHDTESCIHVTMLLLISLSLCKNAEKIWSTHSDLAFKARIHALSIFLPKRIGDILNRIIELKLFYCRVPHKDNSLPSIQKRIAVVSKYWDSLRQIIIYQSQSPLGWSPHPLLRFIKSIRERIIENIADIQNEKDIFIKNINTLCECILDGDPDILSIEEWTNSMLTETENELENLRLQYGPCELLMSEPEEMFFSVLENAIGTWRKQTSSEWQKILSRLERTKNQS